MLDYRKALKGFDLMIDVIQGISEDGNSKYAKKLCAVSALVNHRMVVHRAPIECEFIAKRDSVDIILHWEESGFDDYRMKGLFKEMNTRWQKVERLKYPNRIVVASGKIKIRIEL